MLAVGEDQLHTYDGYRLPNRRYISVVCIVLTISSIRKDRDSSTHDRFLCDPQGFAANIHSHKRCFVEFLRNLRAYLKPHDVTGSEGFLR